MTAPATIGLFEGYGGLTMAVEEVFGAELVAYSEIDPAASKLLAHHHPDIPNLGDITVIDWDLIRVEDGRQLILTGGFPCQDLSLAGIRRGLRPGTRSGLWSQMAYAIDRLRPDLVIIENVRGLLSADAACDLEPCPWCLGDDEGRPLRALGAVLGDLADLGYDARWVGLRAADVGAPHGRFRVFVTAWPAADAASVGRGEGRTEPAGFVGGSDVAVGGDAAVANAGGEAGAQRPRLRPDGSAGIGGRRPDDRAVAAVADTDSAGPQGRGVRRRAGAAAVGDGAPAPADTVRDGREGRQERDLGPEGGQQAPLGGDATRRVLEWGEYEPAIRRWELILGRPAPAPTQTGAKGGQQLSPRFVEWLMGLDDGWVTDPAIGLTRNEQLARLGNGVVPAQAAVAIRYMVADGALAVAA